jgi:hypothetical protein
MKYSIFVAFLLLGAAATAAAQSNPSFELFRDTHTSLAGTATNVVQGDFNNDGKPDIVYSGGTAVQDLVLQLGNGDGTFQAPVTVGTIPDGANDMTAADLNGDGKLDLVATTTDGGLYVFLGNGNGTFAAPTKYATSFSPLTVTTGNFFGDGYLDIAVGEPNGYVELFQNQGGKGFAGVANVSLATTSAVARLRSGDVNGTGSDDLAALTQDAAFILWNDGVGDFHRTELNLYAQTGDISVGDVNQDGRADIIVTYNCGSSGSGSTGGKGSGSSACAGIDVYYGLGNDYTRMQTAVNDPGVDMPSSPIAVDVNGDGLADLAVATSDTGGTQSGLFVWLQREDGTFDPTPQRFIATSNGAGSMAAGDWNRDGMMGFAMALPGDGQNEIFINGANRAPCGTSTVSPAVTVCQPVDDTYSTSPVRVQADAYDTDTITGLQEYVDGKLVYSKDETSFDITLPEPVGPHLFVTKGWDDTGASFVSDRNITVYSGTPGAGCPAALDAAAICLPSGASASSPVQILANGYTSLVPTAAQLYINGDLVIDNDGCSGSTTGCSGGTSYVDTTQTLKSGTYDLVFKLWDAGGNVYQAQKTITVN